jgi:hypothetical protein
VVTLILSAAPTRRAEALTLINPAAAPTAKAASDGMITEIRHGGGGRGGGGFHGGGFRGGGAHFGGGGFRGGGFHAGRIGGFRGGPVYRGHVAGFRYGGYRYGGYRYAGRPYFHRRHYFHRRFYGGYYPYYYLRFHRCRTVWTYYGPRRICRWRHWYPWSLPYYW